mgnify:CR=1 FL=1
MFNHIMIGSNDIERSKTFYMGPKSGQDSPHMPRERPKTAPEALRAAQDSPQWPVNFPTVYQSTIEKTI